MLRQLECTRVRSVGAVWKLGPSGSEGYRFSVLVRNEDEGVVEGCCVRVGNYELNDTFVLEPGEQVHSLEVNPSHRDDDMCIALCRLDFTSTEGQFESSGTPPRFMARRTGKVIRLITVAPVRSFVLSTGWSRRSRPINGRGCRASTRTTGSFAP